MQIIGDIWNVGIIQPMTNSLVLLYSFFFANFGIAIVVFTIIVRVILIPLTVRQAHQLKAMSELQPKMKEIQARFANDKSRQSRETMRLYKENGVNPIGCLGPLVVQLPIWIGLYQSILQTLPSTPERLVGLSRHLYSWLPSVHEAIPIDSRFLSLDLGLPDTTLAMPILVGVSMFLMQKMTTMPAADPRQAQTNRMMLWMMPIMFGFFTTTFPSGLALYWIISNVVGIVIQGFITGWGPLKSIRFGVPGRQETPSALVPSEETVTDERNRHDGQDSRGSNRARPKGTKRRARRGRNRHR